MDFNLEKAEKKYNELLANIGENLSFMNHSQFKDCFLHEYYMMSENGKYDLDVNFNGISVVISNRKDLPNETNGVYRGFKSIDSCEFLVENKFDNDYFCVRKKSNHVYYYPNRESDMSYYENLDVYVENEQVGKSDFMLSSPLASNIEPYLNINSPELTVGLAINGMIPPSLGHYIGNVRASSYGKTPGSAVVKNSFYSCIDGKYSSSTGYSSVSIEKPYSFDGLSEFAKFDNNGELLYLNSQYSNIDEAIAEIQSQYDNSIKNKSI